MATTSASRLGFLTVERPSLAGDREVQLADVPAGISVSAVAAISGFKLFPGRVLLVLDDGQGGSAQVGVDSAEVMAAFRAVGFPPRIGVRVEVHGVVTQPVLGVQKGIAARSIRVVA